jgi:predicted nucleotidyltransferase
MEKRLKDILAELRAILEAAYGDRLVDLVLFGSQARGDAEEGSDIDVMVVLRGPVEAVAEIKRTGKEVAALCLKHDVVITRVFIDGESFEHKQGPLLRNVRREGVRI